MESASSPAPGEVMASGNVVNAQFWHDLSESYVARAHEDRSALSALLIDIDALKATNDELGHGEGDRLIETVNRITAVIPRNLRRSDKADRDLDIVTTHPSDPGELVVPGVELPEPRAARIGGDEFGILLPNTDWEGANAVANRLRGAVREELLLPENSKLQAIGVGVSVGVASLKPDMTASDLLRLADQSMYRDKLRQLRSLSPEEEESFKAALDHLEAAGIRPRDVPKYLQMLGSSAVNRAFENQADS